MIVARRNCECDLLITNIINDRVNQDVADRLSAIDIFERLFIAHNDTD